MTWYFSSAERRIAVCAEARSWIGTPFAHQASVKGAGVDCVHLVGQVMVATGVVQTYNFGDYSLDWGMHQERSKIIDYLESTERFEAFAAGELPCMAGDIICCRMGKAVHHCGIAISPNEWIHARAKGAVTVARLDDPTWAKRWICFYRAL